MVQEKKMEEPAWMIHEELDLTDENDAKVMALEIFRGTTMAWTMDSLMSSTRTLISQPPGYL